MSILKKLKDNSKIKDTSILEDSVLYKNKDVVTTSTPMINVALSGTIFGGLTSGLTILAGPSKHFKTSFALLMAASFLKKHPDGAILFYDSEFGSPQGYFQSFGIDISRVIHTPIKSIEELKFDLIGQLEGLDKKDKVIIICDSIGNLASKKELEDAIAEKSVADMTRAKALKSLFRMITPYLTIKDLPAIMINHTYQTQEIYSKAVVSGGCLVAGTKIIMADGSLREIQDVLPGELVETLDGPQKVTHAWTPETLEVGRSRCRVIKFSDGAEILCTPNHEFLVGPDWLEAKDLKPGTICATLPFSGKLFETVVSNEITLGELPVFDISVENTAHYILENGVVVHNTGVMYSADTVWIIGRQQDKDGTDVLGYRFVINIEKSRFVKEKSKIPISVSWKQGIEKWSGLLDVALEGGYVVKPKNGWYLAVNPKKYVPEEKDSKGKITKEAEGTLSRSLREAATLTQEFWEAVFKNTDFAAFIQEKYQIPSVNMMSDGDFDSSPSVIDEDEEEVQLGISGNITEDEEDAG